MLAIPNRWKNFVAMALLGDAVMAIVRPERDLSAWSVGPAPWRSLIKSLRSHPNLTRALGGVQAAAVMYWIVTHENDR
jgi:hypothetical protein